MKDWLKEQEILELAIGLIIIGWVLEGLISAIGSAVHGCK